MKIRGIVYACLITSTAVCMHNNDDKCYKLAHQRLDTVPYKLIKTHKDITEIDLSYNEITGIDVEKLPPSIKKINLSNNKIEKLDLTLATLLANPNYSINIDNNPLDEVSQRLLAKAIKEHYGAIAEAQTQRNACKWISQALGAFFFGDSNIIGKRQ